ncbi:MAG: hypothetical protein OXF79_16735 [Chloroflexi bacterium]|nr:hypothetical protein [Chloroflexota bacterium]
MPQMPERMSADKSHLLAYLKHTPGFEGLVHSFSDLPVTEIVARVRDADENAYRTCIDRFAQQGIKLEDSAPLHSTRGTTPSDEPPPPARAVRQKLASLGITETDVLDAIAWARSDVAEENTSPCARHPTRQAAS